MLMGSRDIIRMMLYVSLSQFLIIKGTLAMKNSDHDPQSLDDFVLDYARKVVRSPHTGTFYDIPLPSNYSGMDISYIRIRTASLWSRGLNSSFIHIPPKARILPFVKRLDIVFQNLGNFSSYYYNVTNHRLVSPVIGFTIYNVDENSPPNLSSMPDLSLEGNNTVLVQFPEISLKQSESATSKCVRFVANGTVEFSNVTVSNSCQVRGEGHFSIVVPSSKRLVKKRKTWKWGVGLGVGIGGLILLIIVGVFVSKVFRKKRIEGMQRQSEKSEALDTVWVGRSRMPSASGLRTQPVLENDFLP